MREGYIKEWMNEGRKDKRMVNEGRNDKRMDE